MVFRYSSHFKYEKLYLAKVIFNEMMGLEYKPVLDDNLNGYQCVLPNGSIVEVCDDFFSKIGAEGSYLTLRSIPENICWLNAESLHGDKLPVLYGNTEVIIDQSKIFFGSDIFATVFFFITRFEEFVSGVRDKHNRFPGSESLAYKFNFLDRPIVDEYIEMLWQALIKLDGSLTRKTKCGKVNVTCDVDWPYDPRLKNFKHAVMSSASYLINEKKIGRSSKCLLRYFLNKIGIKQKDTYREAISWIMAVNEDVGNKVTFFFIPEKTSELDSDDTLKDRKLSEILNEISSRGHDVGMHPGYNSSRDPIVFSQTVVGFLKALADEKIEPSSIGNRMHYLMWDMKTTPQLVESHNIGYDSTLGFSDLAGFRCGTGHEFTMFDLSSGKALSLKQRPLIAMESSIISKRYEGLGYTKKSYERFSKLKENALKYGGNFTLLWHNCHFLSKEDRILYKGLIK